MAVSEDGREAEDHPASRLSALLTEAAGSEPGGGPSSVELAELLWLAQQMRVRDAPAPTDPRPELPTQATTPGSTPEDLGDPPSVHEKSATAPDPAVPPQPAPRVPVHLPEPDGADTGTDPSDGGFTSLLAPAPPMLTHPLTLQRALRPLKRRVPAPVGQEVDEAATAERIARLAAPPQWWLPVLRPTAERWLRLRIVYDEGRTMPVWRPLLRELRTVLGQSGIFRTLDLLRLTESGEVRGGAAAPADGRTVTLVLSDCMGPQWRAGEAGARWYAALHRWAARHPVAIVQPLPERLWRTTALPATATTLSSPWPAAPNSAYTTPEPFGAGVPLPVLEPSAAWLANWSALVAGSGPVPGAAAHLPLTPPAPVRHADVQDLDPEDLLLRFRSIASPQAYRLAGHLAVGRPHLPYMRLVQAALEPRPQPGHLAEVILSGLLRAVPGGAAGTYAFRDGVREVLLGTLPQTSRLRTRDLLARLGAPIDERAGVAAGEIPVVVPGGNGRGAATAGAEVASVRPESVRRMGGTAAGPSASRRLIAGQYELLRDLSSGDRHVWFARDVLQERDVALRAFPAARRGTVEDEDLLDRARVMAQIRHPNVIRVLQHTYDEDVPHVAQEWVPGVSLGDVLRGARHAGGKLPPWLLIRLAAHTARALTACRMQGVEHGPLKPGDLLIDAADGTVRLSGFMDEPNRRELRRDSERLRAMLQELAADSSFDPWSLASWHRMAGLPFDGRRRAQDGSIWILASDDFQPVIQSAAASAPQFQLLGAQLCEGADRLTPAARACLVALLERHGRHVSTAELARDIWDRPADTSAVLAVIDELCRVLGPGVIAVGAESFAVVACTTQVDLYAIQGLLKDAGPGEVRRDMIQSALFAFDDEPLSGLRGPAVRRVRGTIEELRLGLVLARAEADLELGAYEQAVADLSDALGFHPRHVGFRRAHMLALRGLGRIREAIDSYEEYRRGSAGEPDPELVALHNELRSHLLTTPELGRSALDFELITDESEDHDRAMRVLDDYTTHLRNRGIVHSPTHELVWDPSGFLVTADDSLSVLPLLRSLLANLGELRAQLPARVSMRVTCWRGYRPVGPQMREAMRVIAPAPAESVVVLSPEVYEEAMGGSAPLPIHDFTPLSVQDEVVAYVHRTSTTALRPATGPTDTEPPAPSNDLVRGPFRFGSRAPLEWADAMTAIVYAQLDLGAYDGEDAPTHYYKVSLTVQREWHDLLLPSAEAQPFTASMELTWHVTDPDAFVAANVTTVVAQLLDHAHRVLSRITRRHILARLGAAQQDVQAVRFEPWPVPGLAVTCAVRLATVPPIAQGAGLAQPPQAPPVATMPPTTQPNVQPQAPEAPAHPTDIPHALRRARTVLLGFEGPVTRLYTATDAREVSRELAALIVELRRPDESLRGDRLLKGTSLRQYEGDPHPLDVLRALGGHRLAASVAERLTRLELDAAAATHPTPHADQLIRALHSTGRRVGVVTDVAPVVASTFLDSRGLGGTLRAGVYGRGPDLTRLMPHPECLRRALDANGTAPAETLLVTSSTAELEAARALGLPVIGYARSESARQRLEAAGCHTITDSLGALVEALRTTG
ncbi:SAV_2336 N-terminal domain-related protein [Streptomyces sp. NPDC050418]|uniref:SAV_2336 N-terminal domain-related protein n=1 Tax=Streptomyces sp. NPDC050418 TaxID=3365612 RepID=UPI0037A8E75C